MTVSGVDSGGAPVSRFPNIPLSLYFATVALAQRNGVEYIFTLTEPRLAKHFAMMGVDIKPIGQPVEHRGLRVPSMFRVSEVYPRLRALVRPIWNEVHAQINAGYMLHSAMQAYQEDEEPALVSAFGEISA
jgi:N-acyl amino acid synthase of PEP-CTERM/exosortase system